MKNQRIPIENQVKWNKKSTFYLIVVILAFVALYIATSVIPEYFRNTKVEKYDGKTVGLVLSIKANETISQDFDGAKIVTPYYTVDFVYDIHGKKYENSNNIPNKGKYRKFIEEIYKSNYKKGIIVKYRLINPQESLILIE